jgi:hypothetical protein
MTVGELRKALEGGPDDLEVLRKDERFLVEVYEAVVVAVRIFGDDEHRLGIGEVADDGKLFFLID